MDSVESTRPVRFLLIRGADKEVADNNQQTALQLVDSDLVETSHLKRDLKKILVSVKKL